MRGLAAACGVAAVALVLSACRSGAAPQPPREDVDYIDIDLTEAGMGAKIVAPSEASVDADDDAVHVRGGSDFDMIVRRGGTDLWALRCELASERVPALVRFHITRPGLLTYEVEGLGGSRFHFAATGKAGGEAYTCRSSGDGVTELSRLDGMIRACESVDFTTSEAARSEIPAPEEVADGE